VLAFVVSVNVMVPTGAMFCATARIPVALPLKLRCRVKHGRSARPSLRDAAGLATVIDVVRYWP